MNLIKDINIIDCFLLLFFYELENDLNYSENALSEVKFQSEEANTDEYLKLFFKEYIEKNNKIKRTDIKEVSFFIDNKDVTFNTKELNSFYIDEVLLPEELSEEQKLTISGEKHSNYTNPDLYLVISNGNVNYYESIELKSTKNNQIPGSSVQQVSPYEWVIFVKREEKPIVSIGHYINTITNKLRFPDRSPRPQIGFKNLQKYNESSRLINGQALVIQTQSETNDEKLELLSDWQNYLTNEWMEIIDSNTVKGSEKWFNNAIRKFSIKLLSHSEGLSEEERRILIEKLKSHIK